MSRLSIVIPVLDEAAGIADTLAALAPFRQRGVEVIVVDGGSRDDTVARARPLADQILTAPRGRAAQMNAGAATASSDVLLFLHADTVLPDNADGLVLYGLADTGRIWGRFDVEIEGKNPLLALVAGLMNWRSQITGIATGDQAMFMTHDAFKAVGGFDDIPLMEDIALSKKLKQTGRPLCLAARARTSARRWTQHGTIRTIVLMLRLRFAYWLGADPGGAGAALRLRAAR